ncbi:MAG: damage-inducible protein DinB [Rhizobiaceae bacterium]|nr:damage-inducible protein DinB [Rhizobiaceae bacterium]
MKQHFMMMAAYNRWANVRVYDAAAELSDREWQKDTGAFFGSMMGTLNHLVATDRIWMKRFTGLGEAPRALDAIVDRSFEGLRAARVVEDARIMEWVDALSEEELEGRFTYVTMTDVRTVSQRIAPVLAHLFNHQTHHRGQAHTILTMLGKPSLGLDLVYFQRTEEGRAFA